MKPEFTVDQIRNFVSKNFQSVAACMTKSMLQHYDELSNSISIESQGVQLPDFLYEDEGEIKIGYHGDSVVTDEWNKWLATMDFKNVIR